MPRRNKSTSNDEGNDTRRRSARRLGRSSSSLPSNPSRHTATAAAASKNSSPSDVIASQETVSMNSSSSSRHESFNNNNKKPSALTETTNQRRRKRLAIKEESSSKLQRTSLDVTDLRRSPRLHAKDEDAIHHGTTVTPTPAKSSKVLQEENVDTSSRSLPSSSSAPSSTTSRTRSVTLEVRPRMPDGVVNLYPSAKEQLENNKRCDCRLNHCSPSATTEAYLACYGWEYSKALKEQELCPSSPPPSSDSSTSLDDNDYTCSSITTKADILGALQACVPTSFVRSHSDSSTSTLSTTTSEYTTDTITTMDMNYMPRQPHLTRKMRSILMDWLIELAEEYKLQPSTLFLAATLVDKSLAKAIKLQNATTSSSAFGSDGSSSSTDNRGFIVEKEMLQCLGCSCMWIACKLEELEPPSVDDFVYISDSSYTREQITEMEITVCTAMQFRLWHVTPYCFVHEFLRASQACAVHNCLCVDNNNAVLENMVLYLLELSLLSYKLVMHKPSLLAAAAVYLARVTLGISQEWTRTLQHYTGYSVLDLEETVLQIHKYQREAEESQLKSVYSKYKTEKYMRVSLKTVRHEDDLGF